MRLPLTILIDIEESALREAEGLLSGMGRSDATMVSNDRKGIRPSVHAAVLAGNCTRLTNSSYSTQVTIFLTVISTHPLSEAHRRSEVFPVLTALLMRYCGLKLKDKDGNELPIQRLEPEGKWGLAGEEDVQFAWTIPFVTKMTWDVPDEEGVALLGVELGYLNLPGDDVVDAEDHVELS